MISDALSLLPAGDRGERQSLLRGLTVQRRVIGALILREIHSRWGRENIGYLWLFGEPMLLATVITIIHLNEGTHYTSDIQPAPFAIIAYVIFIIFRNIFNKADGAVEGNQSILYHRAVTIFDVIVARVIVEVTGCVGTLIILMSIAIATGYASLPARPLYLFAAVAMMVWWTLSLTLIASCVTYRSETMSRQLHVLSYFSIPVSGAFFQLSWLPPTIRDKLQWFPMPLIFEQARFGQFRSAPAEYVDPWYVVAWCAVLSYLALVLVRRVRGRISG